MSDDEFDALEAPAPAIKRFSRLKRLAQAREPSPPQLQDEDALAPSNGERSSQGISCGKIVSVTESPSNSDAPEPSPSQESDGVNSRGSISENKDATTLSEMNEMEDKNGGHWDEEDCLEAMLNEERHFNRQQSSDGGAVAKVTHSEEDSKGQTEDDDSCADSQEERPEGFKSGSDSDEDDDENAEGIDEEDVGNVPQGTKSRPARIPNRIGHGPQPSLVPLTDVLSKLKSKAAEAIARATGKPRVSLPSANFRPSAPKPEASSNSSDLLIESDDDQEEVSGQQVPLQVAIGSETQQEFPAFKVGVDKTASFSESENLESLPPSLPLMKTPQKMPFMEMGRRYQEEQRTAEKALHPPALNNGLHSPNRSHKTDGKVSAVPEMSLKSPESKDSMAGNALLQGSLIMQGTAEGEEDPELRSSKQLGSADHSAQRTEANLGGPDIRVSNQINEGSAGNATELCSQGQAIAGQERPSKDLTENLVNKPNQEEPIITVAMPPDGSFGRSSPEDTSLGAPEQPESRVSEVGQRATPPSPHENPEQEGRKALTDDPSESIAADVSLKKVGREATGGVDAHQSQEGPAVQDHVSPTEGNQDQTEQKANGLSVQDEDMPSEEESYAGSSSDSGEDTGDESEENESPGAKARALAEARQMLKDKRPKKRRRDYFEEEAEMSEDEGHSDDGHDSDEDGDHDELLEDLIGYEKEKKGDERRRAEAHAAWLEKQDEDDMKRLMRGIQSGFRKPQGPDILGYEDGSLEDARRRRAAIQAAEGEESDPDSDDLAQSESSSESEEEDQPVSQMDPGALEQLSDDEEKENLQRYQQQKLLKDSQDVEEDLLDALDAGSQMLLESLTSSQLPLIPLEQEPKPKPKSAFTLSPLQKRKTTIAASFLGRTTAVVSNSSRGGAQQNTKSYIFGREDSNSAMAPESEGLDKENAGIQKGPTSFAGIKRSVLGMHKPGSAASFSLLDKLIKPGTISVLQESGNNKMFDMKEMLNKTSKPAKKLPRLSR